MINYTEKGIWLHEEIGNQGHSLIEKDGIWIASNDTAVQGIIDSFDPLPFVKTAKRKEVKLEAAKRLSTIYDFVDDDPKRALSFYEFSKDIYLSIKVSSRSNLQPRLQQYKDIYDAASAAISDIDLITDWEVVSAYDVVATPLWP